MIADVSAEMSGIVPGSVVIVRDEEWLVIKVEPTNDGRLLSCRGLSELVRDTTASFYEGLDTIETLDPAEAFVVADGSPHYRRSRLWLEATLRKTAVPLDGAALTLDFRRSRAHEGLIENVCAGHGVAGISRPRNV